MKREDTCHRRDKIGLFLIAAGALLVVGMIVHGQFWAPVGEGKHPMNETLLGTIVGGLIMFLQKIVETVKAGWDAVTQDRTNEQLAKSAPAPESGPTPADAKQAADQVAGAAEAEADRIADRSSTADTRPA